jgi:hypothetical protein
MSHNEDDVTRSARHHRPAIIAVAVALLVAVLAFLVFQPGTNEQNQGIATTPPPAGTPMTEAGGMEGVADDAVSPEGAAPVTGDAD